MPRQKKQVLKRRADGRYCCTYHGLQFMGRESDEALNKRKEYIMHESEQPIAKSPTVREYIAKWLPLYKIRPILGQKTLREVKVLIIKV